MFWNMLTHVHKCWDTLVLPHGSKGRSWGSFRAALSGRTHLVWGRTCPSWGTGLGNSFHMESGVFCPVRSILGEALGVCVRCTPDAYGVTPNSSELASGASSSCRAPWVFIRCVSGVVTDVGSVCDPSWVFVRCVLKLESGALSCQRQRLLF